MNVPTVSSGSSGPSSATPNVGMAMQKQLLDALKTQSEAEIKMMEKAGLGQNINTVV